LRDAVAGRDLERGLAVGVQQQHLQLAAIAGVDQARRVDERDAVFGGESGARQHEPRVAQRQLDGDARADRRAPSRRERRRLEGVQVVARVVVVCPQRELRGGVQATDREPHAEPSPLTPAALTAKRA
jgi:hypothetical protein